MHIVVHYKEIAVLKTIAIMPTYVKKSVDTSKYMTSNIGPVVDYFFLPKNLEEIKEAIYIIRHNNLEFYILGGGSNTIMDDKMDSHRAIICLIDYKGIKPLEDYHFLVKAGTTLQEVVDYAQVNKLVGITGLNRIPGSLGGATVGNAGAYGTEICQSVLTVTTLDLNTLEIKTLTNEQCEFGYRESLFKHSPNLVVLDIVLNLPKTNDFIAEEENYNKISLIRDEVYPMGFKSPGSVFKNFPTDTLTSELIDQIPSDWILWQHKKLPVAKLLESVGSKGRHVGNVRMRPSHGNILEITDIYEDPATFKDVTTLLTSLQSDIKEKYKLDIEPEIRLINQFRTLDSN
jgi:UDP-N-acetylmuramate dehydrogenase